MLSLQQALQDLTEKLWAKIKDKFIAKEDAINGIVLDPQWDILDTVQNNTSITLPLLDTFDEIYIVMDNGESTVIHQTAIKKESLLSDNENVTYREILLDTLYDAETYVTYYPDTNTIVPSICEGISIDEESNITTTIYTKKYSIVQGNKIAANLLSYDDTTSELGANNVQDAIVKLDEKVDNIPSGGTGKSAYDYAKDNGYTGTEEEFAALMNTNFSTTYLTQENPSGSGTFTFDGDAQFTGDVTTTDEDGNEISLVDIFESTNNLPSAGTKLIETLPANETTVTFTSDEITENTTLNAVYTSIFGVKLESANVENGVLTLTFEPQEEDMTVVALINATMSNSDETHLGDIDADEVKVDDSNLGLGVTNVQGALEKIVENVGNINNELDNLSSDASEITYNDSTVADALDELSNELDNVVSTANSYTDTKVADLVGSAPETLDTLQEVAQAIEENEDVVTALNNAIGSKANQSDLDTTNTNVDNLTTRVTNVENTIPKIQASTTDLTAGTSALASGTIYCVYE